jgi:UDP-3-O-[3-hydroxymyristoyl] glucosamine N-acyltransferase
MTSKSESESESESTKTTTPAARRYAPFDTAGEGDITFLSEMDPHKAGERLEGRTFARCYVSKRLKDWLYREDLAYVKNPKLEFIKDLSRNCYPRGDNYALVHSHTHHIQTEHGSNFVVGDNTSIGFPALSVERDANGNIWRFPHIGRVKVGDNVWIGSNCNISRGVLSDTILKDDVTIDCQVHVAHNCVIGERTLITAGATLGGSVKTGHDCWIGLNATILDHITLGNHVLVAAGATVTKDVPDYDIVGGTPAKSIKDKCTLPKEKRYRMVGY